MRFAFQKVEAQEKDQVVQSLGLKVWPKTKDEETKAESQTETKAESQTETKAEPQTETKAEPQTESNEATTTTEEE